MKPLFHEKTLLKALHNSSPPPNLDVKLTIIGKWVAALQAGTLDAVKEISLHGDFLRDIFCEILDYKSVIQGDGKEWSLHAEANISDGGGSADGAIGFFSAKCQKRFGYMTLNQGVKRFRIRSSPAFANAFFPTLRNTMLESITG